MGKHQLATRGAASCSKHADCPSGDYCDSGHSCYRCSYITPSECDAVDGDCCSVAFRAQCTANPRGCAGPPPPAPPAPPPPPCTGPLDCPARQYCDFDHTCYNCSYLSGGKCDAVNKDCCSRGFLSQCPSNPMHCPPPPPPPACPSPCLAELQATCGADKGKKTAPFPQFYTKMMVLPRYPRHRHRGKPKKTWIVFSQATSFSAPSASGRTSRRCTRPAVSTPPSKRGARGCRRPHRPRRRFSADRASSRKRPGNIACSHGARKRPS
jgi:hypothetical protein